jgi:hypothetical protein
MFEFQVKQINYINVIKKDLDTINSRLMYLLYAKKAGNVNYQGNPMPRYEDLPDNIKENWISVASFFNELYFSNLIDYPSTYNFSHIESKMQDLTDKADEEIYKLEKELYNDISSDNELENSEDLEDFEESD